MKQRQRKQKIEQISTLCISLLYYFLTLTACESGYWGNGCLSKCQCRENSVGCDPVTGQCVCEAGFTGDHCEKSELTSFEKT